MNIIFVLLIHNIFGPLQYIYVFILTILIYIKFLLTWDCVGRVVCGLEGRGGGGPFKPLLKKPNILFFKF